MNLECGCPSHHEHGPEGAAGCPICTPNPIYDFLLSLRTPTFTPEFIELHRRIGEAKKADTLTDALLNECTDSECVACSVIVCPYNEAFHFHHDGCPACSTRPLSQSLT